MKSPRINQVSILHYFKTVDPRIFLLSHHLILVLLSKFLFDLQRSWWQIGSAILFAFLTELILFKTTSIYSNSTTRDRLISSTSEAAGLLVLINSNLWWFYPLTSSIAVASKYLFRSGTGSHLFNPTNFAILFSLSFFPITSFNFFPDEYSLNLGIILFVISFGLLATMTSNRHFVSLGFFSCSFVVSLFLSKLELVNFVYYFGTDFGALGLIFIFLMITDPKTTPQTRKRQFIFGATVAIVHHFLRLEEILYSYFISLFIVSLLRGAYIIINQNKAELT